MKISKLKKIAEENDYELTKSPGYYKFTRNNRGNYVIYKHVNRKEMWGSFPIMKFVEEVFEFKSEMDLDHFVYGRVMNENTKLEMGDIFVTLIILCEDLEINPVICLEMAYEKISKRTGKTINGQFIKSEDL